MYRFKIKKKKKKKKTEYSSFESLLKTLEGLLSEKKIEMYIKNNKSVVDKIIFNLKFEISVPSTPLRLTAYGINSSSVELSWSEPQHKNGIILGYRVFYMHSNFTEVKTLKKNNETIDFLLNDLSEY